jgi:hypothetical protein
MKLIIDMHEKDYQSMKNGHIPFSVLDVLMKGTPLKEWLQTFNTESATECYTAVQRLKEESLNASSN